MAEPLAATSPEPNGAGSAPTAAAGPTALDRLLGTADFIQDPYPVYRRLRHEDPVHWCAPWGAWVVTRHPDVMEVLRRVEDFSSAGYELELLAEGGPLEPGRLPALRRHYSTAIVSTTDPPAHTRLRRLLVKQFTPGVVESLRPRVSLLIGDLLDGLTPGSTVDLLDRLAYPLPAMVIAELLGVPPADQHRFAAWSADIVAFVGTGGLERGRAARAEASMAEFQAYLEPLIARRRRDPGPDLISLLVAPSAEALDLDELVGACVTLLFAGHETTANLIGNGLLALLERPSALERLRHAPDLWGPAVEELLRFDSPVQRNRRRTARDTELAGRRLRAGDRVLAFVGSANRDETIFDRPDELDLARGPSKHLAFGYGIHYCIGAALSRLEAPLALAATLDRFPGIRLATGAPPMWKPNITFRGLDQLLVRL
jgi:cytochrome P450